MPDTYEFVLIPKCEGTGSTSTDDPSQIEGPQATRGNLPIDDKNIGSNKKKVVGTQITVDKGDGSLRGLTNGLGDYRKEMLDSFHIPFR